MKKILLFVALLGLYVSSNAQVFDIMLDGMEYHSGDTMTALILSNEMEVKPRFINTSETDIAAQVVVNAINAPASSIISVCAGECTPGNMSPVFTIGAGTTYTGCVIDFELESSDDNLLYSITVRDNDNEANNTVVYLSLKRSLGIESVAENASISLYPNPASSSLNVRYNLMGESNAMLTLYNMMGSAVMTMPLLQTEGIAVLPVENLPAGLYSAVVATEQGKRAASKVVIR